MSNFLTAHRCVSGWSECPLQYSTIIIQKLGDFLKTFFRFVIVYKELFGETKMKKNVRSSFRKWPISFGNAEIINMYVGEASHQKS